MAGSAGRRGVEGARRKVRGSVAEGGALRRAQPRGRPQGIRRGRSEGRTGSPSRRPGSSRWRGASATARRARSSATRFRPSATTRPSPGASQPGSRTRRVDGKRSRLGPQAEQGEPRLPPSGRQIPSLRLQRDIDVQRVGTAAPTLPQQLLVVRVALRADGEPDLMLAVSRNGVVAIEVASIEKRAWSQNERPTTPQGTRAPSGGVGSPTADAKHRLVPERPALRGRWLPGRVSSHQLPHCQSFSSDR